MSDTVLFTVCAVVTFIFTALILRKLIPVLKSKKMGQHILDIGPRWHKGKEGTPTMGGLAFVIASLVVSTGASVYLGIRDGARAAVPLILTVSYALVCALIGCIDDAAKLRKKQNEGLSAKQKFGLQVVAAALYIAGMCVFCGLSTIVYIPYFNVELDLGIAFYVLAIILLVGVDNSVNIADGIDGLCGSETLIISVFFALAAFLAFPETNTTLAVIAALTAGSAAGLLVYNFYPAKVFMGDTGSLFFGAMVAGAAFVMGNPLIIVVAGFMYIIETISDILQVGYFKLTHGKRLFKMAPIHHHFEKCGFSEIQIVVLFSSLTLLFCVAAWFGLGTL